MPDAKPNRASRGRRRRKGRKSHTTSPQSSAQKGRSRQVAPPCKPPHSPSPQPHPKRRKVDAPSASKTQPGFLQKMRMRLSGGHFRMLNEKLYTCSGGEAFDLFKNDPELFNVYHTGYHEQMLHWPEQPINAIIKWLKNHGSSLTVADFGCGSAMLAKNVKNKVFSIDLVSNDPSIIACDMAHVRADLNLYEVVGYESFKLTGAASSFGNRTETPLNSSSIDVAVFCLSLMGTDYPNYLHEAKRVLKPSGWLLIAEVRSRFDPNNGGASPEKFCDAVDQLGFSLLSKDFSNKMFVLFYFKNTERNPQVQSIDWPELKACIYKRR